MQALIPDKLKIVSSSVPEDEGPEWSDTETYVIGDIVIEDHYIYESIMDNNIDKRPSDSKNVEGAPWRLKDPTNQWACLDWQRSTKTRALEGQQDLVISVPFARPATGFGLLNMDATSVKATVTKDNGEIVWSEDHSLLEDSTSIWHYCFGRFRYTKDLTFTSLPPFTGTLTIELHGNRPAIGTIIVGEVVPLGDVQYGVTYPFKDYSIKQFDEFGNAFYAERQKAKLGNFTVLVEGKDAAYVHQRIMEIGARPTLWRGDNGAGFSPLIIFGRMSDYTPTYTQYDDVEYQLEVEGFIQE